MSSKLWEFFIQDDVESFQQFLANATFAGPRAAGGFGGLALTAANSPSKGGSPIIASSPNTSKQKKIYGASPGTSAPDRPGPQKGNATLSRADVNTRDHFGRTLLHHVASSPKSTAPIFANALLEIPFLDIYAQDWESGWTALHRALYAGNATIAMALMARDSRDATDFNKLGHTSHSVGNLIKIKDREGYSPFDIYGETITSRDIKQMSSPIDWHGSTALATAGSDTASNFDEGYDDAYVVRGAQKSRTDFSADEVFTLGSNKNLNLGLGDQDDRQFPERVTLTRPEHLLYRFYREYQEQKGISDEDTIGTADLKELPTVITNKPIKIQNVAMSKLHTAIITDDPEANLFMCGFGPGGRLGTGDESTRFTFACIETGGLAGKKVMSVALGQDHSLAITEFGEIFSWGSNKFAQLGYSLPRTSNRNDVPMQTAPRQIFNPFKKERILGAAASSIHSVVFSTSGLYTFGKNEGQLGLVDSDARSLEVQTTPRRVGASLLNCPIQMVSAIDRATAVLLQNHEVWVFSQYGYSKLSFPLEASSSFIRNSFMATRYDIAVNHIVKLVCGGNTICALSSSGDIYTAEANISEVQIGSTSTTNPVKIRNSLGNPVRAWSAKKSHMAASDVDVGQDGSIIICTTAGSAWRKEKRTQRKDGTSSKEYKFARIPGLSRVVAVRSNAFGAYAVAQRDCDVTKEQIYIDKSTLLDDLLPLSPFMTPAPDDVDLILDDDINSIVLSSAVVIKRGLLLSSDIEKQILSFHSPGQVWLTASSSDARIPVHEFLLTGRSPVLRKALQEFRVSYFASIPDILDIEYGKDGNIQIKIHDVDLLTVMNVVFFLYTDGILDFWHKARSTKDNATRYRQVRTEVMRIALHLGLPTLERAARLMVEPDRSLKSDMAIAIHHHSFFNDADVVVQLKGGNSVKVHSKYVCQRCPFFDALFHGHSGGMWLKMRQRNPSDTVSIDLKHIDRSTFEFVLRYLYADTEEHLFDEVRCKTVDDLIDLLLDVMYVANELMIDRLSQICQKMLGRFVKTRNISYLLNSIGPIFIKDFKEAALEYICLDLEAVLGNGYLEDLDEDILRELDKVCHENQLACYPVSRGRNSEAYALEKYPEIASSVEADKQRRIDAIACQCHLGQVASSDIRPRQVSIEKTYASPSARKNKADTSRKVSSPFNSPILQAKKSVSDLMFQMDDEGGLSPGDFKGKSQIRGLGVLESRSYPDSPLLGASIPEAESLDDQSFLDEQMASPRDILSGESSTASLGIARHQKRGLGSPPDSSFPPWSSPISNGKKDLKDIMGETSQSRVSNLTLEMAGRRESGGNFAARLSQKERKKMQQQQIQEKLSAQQKAKEAAQNPWQMPQPGTLPTIVGKADPLPGQSGPSLFASEPAKPSQKPSMTLRQTVAGTSPSRSAPLSTPPRPKTRNVSVDKQQSPFSKPSPSEVPTSSQQSLPKTSPQPVIQSIRHIPRPTSESHPHSYGSLSLTAILHQQQIEKDEIREAATAKHNMQEIQAEQEFQQWWEQESKRVQGLMEPELEQRGAKAGRGKSSGPAANSRRRRGGNKNAPVDGTLSQSPKQVSSPNSGHAISTKNLKGHATKQTQANAATGAPSKNSRRGGHGHGVQRGKGKDRE
ncbi:hypothetical protein N7495_004312 [Penicillium taxi]|uniref:uncharacterized protein n=1 Tax=Penicillium taxi TaxID=168475 RepID=UPI00254564CB|nr:uncharacterized protein N7495_004312 [Penicillium taxi]KAJ5899568.1 hypothetical protein N7495_004312 [Penicillium taxi]